MPPRPTAGLLLSLMLAFAPNDSLAAPQPASRLEQADRLLKKGQYSAALAQYESVLAGPARPVEHARALFHAAECEQLLGRLEQALDRLRAAKIPADEAFGAVVLLLRIEALYGVERLYGLSQEIEEGAPGSARLSRAQAKSERQAALGVLWEERKQLAAIPLERVRDLLVLSKIDGARYPAVWDFIVLRLFELFQGDTQENEPTNPIPFADATFTGRLDAPAAITRLGVLYEETGHLGGGAAVDRAVADELARIERVLLPRHLPNPATSAERKIYLEHAAARLREWSTSMRTPRGRAQAAAEAAEILESQEDPSGALGLCEAMLKKAPEGEAAMHCRRLRAGILRHELALQAHTSGLPARDALSVRARNLGTLHLRLYAIDPLQEATDRLFSGALAQPSPERIRLVLRDGKPLATWSVPLPDAGAHKWVEQRLGVPASALGLYLVVAAEDPTFGGTGQTASSAVQGAFVNVTDLALARARTEHETRYYVFDAKTGAAAKDVRLTARYSDSYAGAKHSAPLSVDKEGVARFAAPTGTQTSDALAQRGAAVAYFPGALWHGLPPEETPLHLFLASDRPIYRPGQTALLRVTSIQDLGKGPAARYRIDGGRSILLGLRDPSGKEVVTREVKTGALGSAAVSFVLPARGLIGRYTALARVPALPRVTAELGLAVEEYKRPELELTLEPPQGAARYRERMTLRGSARFYFGAPAPDLQVHFRVLRRRFLPWWPWLPRPGIPESVEIARGERKTDARGAFEVAFTAEPDPTRLHDESAPDLPDIAEYEVRIETHDAGGRTLESTRAVRAGAQSLLLSAQGAQGFFLSDESPKMRLRQENLDEVPVAGQASWRLERLGPPKTRPAVQKADAQEVTRLLADYPASATVAKGQVRLQAAPETALALPPEPAGAYRLILEARDPFGRTVRSTVHFLVADAKSRALSFSLPPIALPRQLEAQPGQTIQFLLGADRAAGAYHIEVWQGASLQGHRFERGAPVRVVEIPIGAAAQAGGCTVRWLGVAGLEVIGGEASLRVPRTDKALTVHLAPHREALHPGETAHLGLEVRDGRGRPVAGEALVMVYDRSLELYARERSPWVDSLYQPSLAPPEWMGSLEQGFSAALPLDPSIYEHEQQQIRGRYHEPEPPRFSWQPTLPFGRHRMSLMGRGGAVPPPMAAPAALNEVAPRTNMAETALFLPNLRIDAQGHAPFSFTLPERLTSWRIRVLALGPDVQAGTGEDALVTRKELMVRLELPRFVREGDHATAIAVVHNETDRPLEAQVVLAARRSSSSSSDPHAGSAALALAQPSRTVSVPPHGLASADFPLTIPDGVSAYTLRATATASSLVDAEERELPALPARERQIQSRLVALRGEDAKTLSFPELAHPSDASRRSELATLDLDPQLALPLLRAIPFLVDVPFDCVESILNRYVPLAIVGQIYRKHPELARSVASLPHRTTRTEPWRADDPRRTTALAETPWLWQAEGGDAARLTDLLDPKHLSGLGQEAMERLAAAQLADGSFPWFKGGPTSLYMTLYVLEQLAQLQDFGLAPPEALVARALAAVTQKLPAELKATEPSVAFLAYGAYVLTAFDPRRFPAAGAARTEVEKWTRFVLDNRQILTPFGRAWMARVLDRQHEGARARELLESALDGARTDPVAGISFAPERFSWLWYQDTLEKHAFLLRTLALLKPGDARIAGLVQWLLANRRGTAWRSTKASAAAVYALLAELERAGALGKPEHFSVHWGPISQTVEVKPDDAATAPLEWRVAGADVTPMYGTAHVEKSGPGIAFASSTWIYASTAPAVAQRSELLGLERSYFRKVHRDDGDHLVPLGSGAHVQVGEAIEVRLRLRTRSALEFLHLREPHGGGFEEGELRSGYRFDKVIFYEEMRDSLINFFLDRAPEGEVELRHTLRPTTPGHYRVGPAVIQSLYAPDVTATSAGMELTVER